MGPVRLNGTSSYTVHYGDETHTLCGITLVGNRGLTPAPADMLITCRRCLAKHKTPINLPIWSVLTEHDKVRIVIFLRGLAEEGKPLDHAATNSAMARFDLLPTVAVAAYCAEMSELIENTNYTPYSS